MGLHGIPRLRGEGVKDMHGEYSVNPKQYSRLKSWRGVDGSWEMRQGSMLGGAASPGALTLLTTDVSSPSPSVCSALSIFVSALN